jgi:hypothetical protein
MAELLKLVMLEAHKNEGCRSPFDFAVSEMGGCHQKKDDKKREGKAILRRIRIRRTIRV